MGLRGLELLWALLRGGCGASLTHAEGRLVHSPQEQRCWNWRGSLLSALLERVVLCQGCSEGALYTRQRGGGRKQAAKGGAITPKRLGGARSALQLVSALLTTNLEGKSAGPCSSVP